MKKMILLFTSLSTILNAQLFINEIDYDQPSTDASEFIELSGPVGSYSNVNLVLINGNNYSEYGSYNLGTVSLNDETQGYGFYVIGTSSIPNVDFTSGFPSTNAIQNGDPDGVELWVNGELVDAVSYAGTMDDSAGGTMEEATPNDSDDEFWEGGDGLSIGRLGIDGSPWSVMSNSPGTINQGQIFDPDADFAPSANAGSDQLVQPGDLVTLDGSASFYSDGEVTSYLWEQSSGPDVVLSTDVEAVATFTFPDVTETTELVFELSVTDDGGNISSDEVNITAYMLTQTDIYDIQENFGTYDGQVVNVIGVVTIGDSLLYPSKTKFYIQDESGRGIQIYNDPPLEYIYSRGDSIEVTGTVTQYNDDVEITEPTITLLGTGSDLPEAHMVTGSEGSTMNGTWADATGTLSDYWHYQSGSTEFTALTITTSQGTDIQTMFWNSAVPSVELAEYEDLVGEELSILGVITFYNGAVQLTCGYETDIQSNTDPTFPVADAGPDQYVSPGDIVILDGSASSDSNGSIFAYEWVQIGGTPVVLDNENDAITFFTAPNEIDIISFRLTVWDDEINESTDEVDITVSTSGPFTMSEIINNCGEDMGESLTCDGQYDLSSDSAGECPLYETQVTTTGTIIDYFDITPFNGPYSFTIQDSDENQMDFVVWPESSEYQDGFDITQTDLNVLTQPPFGVHEVTITGELGAYCDDDELLNINSEWQVTVEYESNITINDPLSNDPIIPIEHTLFQNYPNPFNPETMIKFEVTSLDHINISIFDLKGNLILDLVDKSFSPGEYSVAWDGKNKTGELVPSGLYIYQYKSSTNIVTKRMLLVK